MVTNAVFTKRKYRTNICNILSQDMSQQNAGSAVTESAIMSLHIALWLTDTATSHCHVSQLQEEGNLESSIACYELALSMDVHYAKSSLSLGALYKTRGKTHDATLAQVSQQFTHCTAKLARQECALCQWQSQHGPCELFVDLDTPVKKSKSEQH